MLKNCFKKGKKFIVKKIFRMVKPQYRYTMTQYYQLKESYHNKAQKAILLVTLGLQNLLVIRDRKKCSFREKRSLWNRPVIGGAESALSKRKTYTLVAKLLLQYDVISFDIFDTLLLRPFNNPTTVFYLLSEKHGIPSFAKYRIAAEREARERAFEEKESREVTLFDIYRQFQRYCNIDVEYAVACEIEVEKSILYANPYIKEVYSMAKQLGKKVVAVSDMYIPQQFMRELLKANGYDEFDEIFVSCDYGVSKRNGELYQVVKHAMGEELSYYHIGDNYAVDVKAANDNGVTSMFYQNVNNKGNSKRCYDMSTLIGSAYAGIVNAKLHNGLEVYSVAYEYGYIYGGLLVLGYCNWLHEYKKSNQIDKLLFLSRDGDVVKQVYNLLYPMDNTEYVYWSRVAGTQATVKKFRNEFLLRYVRYKIPREISLKTLLQEMNLEEMIEYYSKEEISPDTILTKENYETIIQVLLRNWDVIVDQFEDRNKAAKQYYSEVVKDCTKVCAVDIGWCASGATSLKYLIEDEWKLDCKVTGAIVGSKYLHDPEIIEAQLLSNDICTYSFSQMNNRDIYKGHNIKRMYSAFTELLMSSPSPSFKGFTCNQNGEIGFEFEPPEVEGYDIMTDIQSGIVDFCKEYNVHFKDYPFMRNIPGTDGYAVVKHVLRYEKYFLKNLGTLPVKRGVGTYGHRMEPLSQLIGREYQR